MLLVPGKIRKRKKQIMQCDSYINQYFCLSFFYFVLISFCFCWDCDKGDLLYVSYTLSQMRTKPVQDAKLQGQVPMGPSLVVEKVSQVVSAERWWVTDSLIVITDNSTQSTFLFPCLGLQRALFLLHLPSWVHKIFYMDLCLLFLLLHFSLLIHFFQFDLTGILRKMALKPRVSFFSF